VPLKRIRSQPLIAPEILSQYSSISFFMTLFLSFVMVGLEERQLTAEEYLAQEFITFWLRPTAALRSSW
jgi:hypothetical protein